MIAAQAGRLSAWQEVIHGTDANYRRRMALLLYEIKGERAAERFALCGRGDRLLVKEDGSKAAVEKHGCGERVCQRCSRGRAMRQGGKVLEHLRAREHGFLYHMVLTQQNRLGDTVREAAERMRLKWKKLAVVLERDGMTAAFVCVHCTWSKRQTWHYHYHVLVESGREVDTMKVGAAWSTLCNEEMTGDGDIVPRFMRLIVGPGPAMSGLDDGTSEFWREARTNAEVLMQYLVRDAGQGTERWGLGVVPDGKLKDFIRSARSLKWYRLIGAWRKPVEKSPETEAMQKERSEIRGRIGWVDCDTVDNAAFAARRGVMLAVKGMQRLYEAMDFRGALAQRMSAFWAWVQTEA